MSSATAAATLKHPTDLKRNQIGTDSLILGGVFLVLLLAPLAFGSMDPWAISALQAGSALLFAVWLWRQSFLEQWSVRSNPLFSPMLLFAAIVVVQIVFGWTAYRHATISEALLYIAYAMLAFLVTQCLRRSSQAKVLAIVISLYGVAVAGFALLQGLSPNGKIYWVLTPAYSSWIYGPYPNHNHYAGLMEMLTPMLLVFCLTRYARGRVRTVAAAGAALMAGTIFFSGSRGGMVAFAAELILLGVFVLRMQKRPRLALGLGVFAVLMVALLAWIGGVELSKRVGTISIEARHELSGGLRWTVDKDGLRMFVHKPVLGYGLATFRVVYPQFRHFYSTVTVNEAHNDYLQLLVETGVLGFAALLWFLYLLFRNAFRTIADWPDDINGAVSLACLLGCTGILVHGFVDFNLQVPANAAWFYVLATIAASPYTLESRRRIRRRTHALHSDFEPDSQVVSAEADSSSEDEPSSL